MINKWMIRTKSNKIFGPVTRDKILDLLKNKSLRDQDEICCGNGFWINIVEKDLIQKYLFDNKTQPFNPISEAPTLPAYKLVVFQKTPPHTPDDDESNIKFPATNDLTFPDDNSSNPDINTAEDNSALDNTLIRSIPKREKK